MAFRYSALVASPTEQSPVAWRRRSQPELARELEKRNSVEQVPLSDLVSSRLSSMPERGRLHDFLHQMSSRRRRSQPVSLQSTRRSSGQALVLRDSTNRDDALRSPQHTQITRSTSMDTDVLIVNSFEEEEDESRSIKHRHSEKKSKRRSRRLKLLSRKQLERSASGNSAEQQPRLSTLS